MSHEHRLKPSRINHWIAWISFELSTGPEYEKRTHTYA